MQCYCPVPFQKDTCEQHCSEEHKSGWLCYGVPGHWDICVPSRCCITQIPYSSIPRDLPREHMEQTNQLRPSIMKQIHQAHPYDLSGKSKSLLLLEAKVLPVWRPRARYTKGRATNPSPTDRYSQAAW